jgi:thiol-disulfide isomerase/thioredoxin
VAKAPVSKRPTTSTKGPQTSKGAQPPRRPPPQAKGPSRGGRPAGLFTWLAVGLVIVVVVGLVIIKVTSGSPSTGGSSGFQAASPAVVKQLTDVPASVFNEVGVTSPVAQVTPPGVVKGQPALTATSASGATLPEVLYVGAEYCPFCAAQRWTTIIALSRFGTFSNLGDMTSSSIDEFPSTPTFTFLKASYKSKYLVFKTVEEFTNISDAKNDFYYPLQKPTKAEQANFKKYDTSKYIPGLSAQSDGSIPYISFGNKFLVSGASYTPATLANLSRDEIAAGLSEASNPVTQAIISSANYQTAAICTLTNNQPSKVCSSSGVMAAKKVMGLTK